MRLFSKAIAIAGVMGASVTVFAACSSSDNTTPTADAGPGGDSGPAAVKCVAPPGTYPVPTCANATCPATAANLGCQINEAKCGSKSTCLPLADNGSKTIKDFRIRRLFNTGPAALIQPFIQATVVTNNIDLKAPECGEQGQGGFNWLLRLDTTNNTLTTGGAPPAADPFAAGYCFFNSTTGGVPVKPVTVPAHKNQDGSWSADAAPTLNVPIFLNGVVTDSVVLPLSEAKIENFTVSADSNCIGTFNEKALDATCQEDAESCPKWNTAGNIGGFITLEGADTVNVATLSESMCVLLTGSTKNKDNKCARDANNAIIAKGDYCSVTKTAGGCGDSFWLASTFAASAVTINDGAGVDVCAAATP
jgi:hypothetical protein